MGYEISAGRLAHYEPQGTRTIGLRLYAALAQRRDRRRQCVVMGWPGAAAQLARTSSCSGTATSMTRWSRAPTRATDSPASTFEFRP